MHAAALLLDNHAHMPALDVLDGITPDVADRRVAGATHSIAEIVAHMALWQHWFCDRCAGTGEPPVSSAALGWPEVTPGSWETIRTRFAVGLERAAALGQSDTARAITPAIEFPPLAAYTVRDAIEHMATHNSHHLGQVVLLRQMIGAWPPPSGSYTW